MFDVVVLKVLFCHKIGLQKKILKHTHSFSQHSNRSWKILRFQPLAATLHRQDHPPRTPNVTPRPENRTRDNYYVPLSGIYFFETPPKNLQGKTSLKT